MPSYTTSLRLIQPATGEYSGSWGTQVNNGITALVDTSVAGTASITMTTSDYTLSTANGATDEARAMFLVLGGTPGAARNVICPAVSKLYYVTNNTTGGFAQTVKTASGSGISVPNGASMVLRCDGTNVVEAQNSLGSIVLNGGTANGVAYLNASKALTTGSALVFDGTNLGVGTSSPNQKLDVAGSVQIRSSGTHYLNNSDNTNQYYWQNIGATGANNATLILSRTNAGETLRVDSSGNLGLGVTPSAWNGAWKVFSASRDATFGGTDGGSVYGFMAVNAYADGSAAPNSATWRYKLTGSLASKYEQTSGEHRWFTAPSGTAGNAITFTQAMTLDASGNLGIGTSSPATTLHVQSATGQARVQNTSSGTALIGFRNSVTTDVPWVGTGGDDLRFTTLSTERARITSAGDLLVGLSTATFVSTRLEVEAATNNNALGAKTTQNNYAPLMAWNSATSGDNLFQYFYTEGALTLRGSIDYNRAGGLTRYNTTSDYRAKDIIGPVQNPGATIDALKVYEGVMKGATQSRPMLIAHEAQAHAPYAVSGVKDEVNEDGTPKFQQMDVSSLVPLLLAEIQSLRARVAALEQA